MTVIIAVLTEHYAILASDLRKTQLRQHPEIPGEIQIVSQVDEEVKSTILDSSQVMGFWGVARINDERMESLIHNWLRPIDDAEDYFSELSKRMTEELSKPKYVRKPTHGFVTVGFHRGSSALYEPRFVIVSNSLDDRGNYSPGLAAPDFRIHKGGLDNGRPRLLTGGATLPKVCKNRLERALRVNARRHPLDPYPMYEHLREAVRSVASVNIGVSSSMIITSIPKAGLPLESATFWFGAPGRKQYQEFEVSTTFNHDGNSWEPGPIFHPSFMKPGGATSLGGRGVIGSLNLGIPDGMNFGVLNDGEHTIYASISEDDSPAQTEV